jgi:glycerophosphoryl diester phosphodiesterase
LPQFKRHLLVDYRQDNSGRWSPAVDEVIERIRATAANGLGTQNRLQHFNREFVDRLRAAGVAEFHVWTVDSPVEAREYRSLGVETITTNRPAQLRAALTAR